ncbi:MAG TPA: ABC transporter ATP-binding protein [Acetobacteraceae bacterium]|jgi:zinc/manganese transport system ATP-binding protein|nr:ABC transporter ATP-binding protein [Acetobacteraceae bacterium]
MGETVGIRHRATVVGCAGVTWARRLLAQAITRSGRLMQSTFDGAYVPQARVQDSVAIELDCLSAGYGVRQVLEDITGRFEPGSLTAIVGPNGAGKSTLLNVLAGLKQPRSGTILLRGIPPESIGFLPQIDAIDRSYPISVLEFVALGQWARFGAFRTPSYDLMTEVVAALRAVGMQDAATSQIGDLSIGQFRRVLFARLIVQDARLLLLDEPFGGMDLKTTTDLLALLQVWHREGRTIVAVLHDLNHVGTTFPSTLLLARRVIAWGETSAVLAPDNLARAGMGEVEPGPRIAPLRLVPS